MNILISPALQNAGIVTFYMQAIGVLGESLLLLNLEAGHALLRQSVGRFILFDAVGLGLLILAAILVFYPSHKDST